MAEHTQPPAPDPFDPMSEKEVTERFGSDIGLQWLAAGDGQRRAMIRQLLSRETERMKDEQETRGEDDAIDQWRAELRAKTFVLRADGDGNIAQQLMVNRNRYEEEMTRTMKLLQGGNASFADRLQEEASRRCLHIHVIDLLLHGQLAFNTIKTLVREDEHGDGLSDIGIECEYDDFLDRLLFKQLLVEVPSKPAS